MIKMTSLRRMRELSVRMILQFGLISAILIYCLSIHFDTFPNYSINIFKNINHILKITGESFSTKTKFCFVQDSRVNITRVNETQSSQETFLGGAAVVDILEDFTMEPEESYCVPKTIHFIWVGVQIKEKYQKNIKTFTEVNPGYEVYLWTEVITDELKYNMSGVIIQDVNKEIETYSTKDLVHSESNPGGKSDILRYEVIYRHGGVYFDTDSVSVLPLGDFLTHSFVSHINKGYNNVCNAVFGFPKGSRFLEFALRALRENYNKNPDRDIPYKTGPAFFSGAFLKYNDSNINMVDQKYLVIRNIDSIVYQTMDASWGRR